MDLLFWKFDIMIEFLDETKESLKIFTVFIVSLYLLKSANHLHEIASDEG
jgi:hypothetical protein